MVNQKDVAKLAGVSTATVSAYLNENKYISDKLRKKVQKAIEELNYEINTIAKSLKEERNYTIGIIVGNIASQFYSTLAKSIEDTANKSGYNVILCNSDYDSEKELKYLKVLKSNRVSGIIITPIGKNAEYVNQLIDADTKVVLLDRLIEGVECDAVKMNNIDGAYKAVSYLISRGYKRIGIITGNIDITTGKERYLGYIKALEDAGILKNDELIKFGDFKKESGIRLTKELLKGSNTPEAIFTTNIDTTIGSLITIKEMNLKIPDDIAIVGFDDSDWSIILDPPLTAVSQPIYKLGKTATEILIKKIENGKKFINEKPKIMTYETNFIIRNSTK